MTAIQVAVSLAAVSLLTRPPLAELRHLAGRWRWRGVGAFVISVPLCRHMPP